MVEWLLERLGHHRPMGAGRAPRLPARTLRRGQCSIFIPSPGGGGSGWGRSRLRRRGSPCHSRPLRLGLRPSCRVRVAPVGPACRSARFRAQLRLPAPLPGSHPRSGLDSPRRRSRRARNRTDSCATAWCSAPNSSTSTPARTWPPGTKSLAFHLNFQAADRTLTSEEVNPLPRRSPPQPPAGGRRHPAKLEILPMLLLRVRAQVHEDFVHPEYVYSRGFAATPDVALFLACAEV